MKRIRADGERRDEKIPWLTQFVCVSAPACLTLRARLRAQEGKISGSIV